MSLDSLLDSALVFRARRGQGAPALSLDDGETILDPRGRKAPVSAVWSEVDEDPEDVYDELTDNQRAALDAEVARRNVVASKPARTFDRTDFPRAARAVSRDEAVAALAAFDGEGPARIGGWDFYRQHGSLCVGFVKRGGHRTWLLPVTREDALDLASGRASVRYVKRSNRARVVRAGDAA